ncbi:hypothetical protein BQ8482_70041 [Mesorhizobium delmotii]|uniref:Uncharacterized protein n=1 Tax=Mesorhizobium delmotii TaxID=1631247 RepID=A0A2P9AVY7_9HYPH|nr:hypothetical protein BQ8482_70041 [Mesorhizobium delmotii]
MRKHPGGEILAQKIRSHLTVTTSGVQRVLGSRAFATVMQPGALIKNSACVRRLSRRERLLLKLKPGSARTIRDGAAL